MSLIQALKEDSQSKQNMIFLNIYSNICLIPTIRSSLDTKSRELSNDTIFSITASVIDSE